MGLAHYGIGSLMRRTAGSLPFFPGWPAGLLISLLSAGYSIDGVR
jgi:hypothetical protein